MDLIISKLFLYLQYFLWFYSFNETWKDYYLFSHLSMFNLFFSYTLLTDGRQANAYLGGHYPGFVTIITTSRYCIFNQIQRPEQYPYYNKTVDD